MSKTPGSKGLRWTGRKLQNWRTAVLSAEPLCRACTALGLVRLAEEVDHRVPLEKGGDYSFENANPLCRKHHRDKTAADRGYRPRPTIGLDGYPTDER